MTTKPKTILSVFGTRPEAIKMAPLIKALEAEPGVRSVVCVTGQHRSMLKQVLDLFEIEPQHDLKVMSENQSLNGLASKLIGALDDVITESQPSRVIVHGDTTTATAGALAAFHRRIPVAHVEAGLRTGDMDSPWPEEMNRRVVDVVSDLMFVPTPRSEANIAKEGLPGRSVVTGNTVIDALLSVVRRIEADAALRVKLDARFPFLDPSKKLVLVTGHRRESFGQGLRDICAALAQLAQRRDVQIVYPVHLNPNVQATVISALGGAPNVFLIQPQNYMGFVRLLQRATVVLTDSGGVQEEAPALGKPVLVMRDVTERPEAVQAGTARLVGTDTRAIVCAVSLLLDDANARAAFARSVNPYGDGRASSRIVSALMGRPFEAFHPEPIRDRLDPAVPSVPATRTALV
jgi:UDP-N-acetylglucosamine 2-epimerase (non-hydrolysing)